MQTHRWTPCQKLCHLGTTLGEKVGLRISTTPKGCRLWTGEETWNIKVGGVTFGHEIQCCRFCTVGQMTFQGADSRVNVKAIRPCGRRVGTRCFSGRDEIAVPEMLSLTRRACVRWPIHLSGTSAVAGGFWRELSYKAGCLPAGRRQRKWAMRRGQTSAEQLALRHTNRTKAGVFNIQDSCSRRLDFCLCACV